MAAEQTHASIAAVVHSAQSHEPSNDDVAYLAQALARSGAVLPRQNGAADIASTGGPSSLSTLLCPLFLRTLGILVPKLGIPGRPAGGVDVLSTIPGYSCDLSPAQVERCLEACGYAHFLPSLWAPLDGHLFRVRQSLGAQDSPALVIASLLSKKLATGVTLAGIDVRVGPHGNFGKDFASARKNSSRLLEVANILGIRTVAFLTDAAHPCQPWIGRGESLLALKAVFEGSGNDWLSEHVHDCHAMALQVAGAPPEIPPPEPCDLYRCFTENLRAQGSHETRYFERVREIEVIPREPVLARASGYFHLDLSRLRDVLVSEQGVHATHDFAFPDPAGVVLLARPGSLVAAGEPVLTLRGRKDLEPGISAALSFEPQSRYNKRRPIESVCGK